jgi:hypothetical protein
MLVFRVFPWVEGAPRGRAGLPLFVPTPQGSGRVDNPGHYLTLYVSDAAPGAVAEAFGNHAVWTDDLVSGPPMLPGSVRALATYQLEGPPVLDLDDCGALGPRDLRPSNVVTRERTLTQAWALLIHQESRWAGVRWWSFYDPDWGSFGVWDQGGLKVQAVEPLRRDHPAVADAAAVLSRSWRS